MLSWGWDLMCCFQAQLTRAKENAASLELRHIRSQGYGNPGLLVTSRHLLAPIRHTLYSRSDRSSLGEGPHPVPAGDVLEPLCFSISNHSSPKQPRKLSIVITESHGNTNKQTELQTAQGESSGWTTA